MTMPCPFWHHLLSAYCENGAGLSLPHLVGASAIHSGKPPHRSDAAQIVSEMVGTVQQNLRYHVSLCGKLKVPVFGVLEGWGTGMRVDLGPEWGATNEGKLLCVVERSAAPIDAATYSRVRGATGFEWGAFTSDEDAFIRDVIKRYQGV